MSKSIPQSISKIIIAIDGPAGAGKSSVAKIIASKLNLTYIDTGAMYRAVTWLALRNSIMLEAQKDILLDLLSKAEITLLPGEKRQRVLLNGFEITDQIRTPEIVKYVSQVSAIPEVRSKLVSLQQQMGEVGGVIMDGRDIGTTVFPNAGLKIFLIASSRERASRRQIQQRELGIEEDLDSIQAEIERRDFIDTTRAVSPLSQAADAILIDTDQITIYEVVDKIIATLNTKLGESKKGF